MRFEDLISVTDFCASHNISHTLIIEFREYGLVQVVEEKEALYIPMDELSRAERLLRLHADLDINLEGVAVIDHLLERMEELKDETRRLRNRLRLYE